MREIFIDGLYKVSVSQARMQLVVDGLDPVSLPLLEVYIVQVSIHMMFLVKEFSTTYLLRFSSCSHCVWIMHRFSGSFVK